MKKILENTLLIGFIGVFIYLLRDFPNYARLVLALACLSPFMFILFKRNIVAKFLDAGENRPAYALAQTFNIVLILGCFNLNFFIPLIFLPLEVLKTVYLYKVVK